MNDYRSLVLLDNTRQDSKNRRQAGVSMREYAGICTFDPGDIDWCVYSFLHLFAIKVDRTLLVGKRATDRKD